MGARGALAPPIFYILVNVYLVIYIVMKLFILHMILNEPPPKYKSFLRQWDGIITYNVVCRNIAC